MGKGWPLFTWAAILVLTADLAHAMPAPLVIKPGRISAPMESGDMIGGQAGDEFSLLGVRSEALEGGSGERLVLAYGDRFGKPQKGEPGYFHVALDRDSRRLVIDLAQMHKTAVDPSRLARILATSKLITGSDMTMDPADGSTNITLLLKVPVRVKVASMTNEPARVVIEIEPLPGHKP